MPGSIYVTSYKLRLASRRSNKYRCSKFSSTIPVPRCSCGCTDIWAGRCLRPPRSPRRLCTRCPSMSLNNTRLIRHYLTHTITTIFLYVVVQSSGVVFCYDIYCIKYCCEIAFEVANQKMVYRNLFFTPHNKVEFIF